MFWILKLWHQSNQFKVQESYFLFFPNEENGDENCTTTYNIYKSHFETSKRNWKIDYFVFKILEM